jgi:hypothetical protein
MLSSAPPALPGQPPQPSSARSAAAAASPDASRESNARPGGGGAISRKSAQDAGQSSGYSDEPQLMGGWDGGTAFSWDGDAVAAADPFATAHTPNRLFKLSAAPADVLGLHQCSDGRLQLAEDDASVSQPATSSDAAQQLSRQLAAAAAAPSWPPCSNGSDTGLDAGASAQACAGGDAGLSADTHGMSAPQSPTALLQAAAAKPGTGTGWGGAGPTEPEAAAAPQQEAGEADPSAPSTSQRDAEYRRHVHASAAAAAGAAAAASDAQGPFGSPLLMRMLPAQTAAGTAASPAAPVAEASAPVAEALIEFVTVDEAALVQTALLALQVTTLYIAWACAPVACHMLSACRRKHEAVSRCQHGERLQVLTWVSQFLQR